MHISNSTKRNPLVMVNMKIGASNVIHIKKKSLRRLARGRSRARSEGKLFNLGEDLLLIFLLTVCVLIIGVNTSQLNIGGSTPGEINIIRETLIINKDAKNVDFKQLKESLKTLHKANYLKWKNDIQTPRDFFSASWLQPVENFMKISPETIQTVEDGVFKSLGPLENVRMTKDWLDFSVEHLSHWWKTIDVFHEDHSDVFNSTIAKFEHYINHYQHQRFQEEDTSKSTQRSPLHPTIAIIAFMPYKNKRNPELGTRLTVHSLAASIASLQRIKMGRVLVVGQQKQDQAMAKEAFRLVRKGLDNQNQQQKPSLRIDETMIGETEVQFVLSASSPRTKYIQFNLPKVSIQGLQYALSDTNSRFTENRRREWLGETHNASYWKYVYLTEPDTILNARSQSLLQLKQDVLDQGLVLTPHRLQPIPHASDIQGTIEATLHLPSNFSAIHTLDGNAVNEACCDDGNVHPGPDIHAQSSDGCDKYWFQCGFQRRRLDTKESGSIAPRFDRLEPYSLIRLSQGTGIVNLAASNHGRRCIPTHKSKC